MPFHQTSTNAESIFNNFNSTATLGQNIEEEEKSDESELLVQLQELHQQLVTVRERAKQAHPTGTRIVEERHKLIICACRKPVNIKRGDEGDVWVYEESMGAFKSAVDFLTRSNRVRWVSWPGSSVDPVARAGVRKRLDIKYNCTPVFLSEDVEDLFCHQFCKGVLWPLFHCIPASLSDGLLDNFLGQYEAYAHANRLFLDAVASVYEEGDLVLVCDYELMLLPALLRKRFPEITSGFFLHCPFPSTEFYRMLPVRMELLQGILGADLVSFNHFDYVRHFLNSCTRILGLESYPSRIEYKGRLVSVSICPMGINPEDFELSEPVRTQMKIFYATHRFKGRKIIVSIDRLDLCKGMPLKLLAMESLLERYPQWRNKLVLFAIVRDDRARGRGGDKALRKAVDALVGRVNGRYGTADYCPVVYIKGVIPRTQIIALQALADVALVASLREGVNLGAMEFIACQQETRQGVLVYSEFAGCASSFKGAMLVNPHDPDGVADAMHNALTMSLVKKRIRHLELSRYVNHYTSSLWARTIVGSLRQSGQKAREYNRLQRLDVIHLKSFYCRSRRRLIVLDYDGTLVEYSSIAQLAAPPQPVLAALAALCEDPANIVYVVSGRKKSELEKWLGHIPSLGLMAEHGYYVWPAAAHRSSLPGPIRNRKLKEKSARENRQGRSRDSPRNKLQELENVRRRRHHSWHGFRRKELVLKKKRDSIGGFQEKDDGENVNVSESIACPMGVSLHDWLYNKSSRSEPSDSGIPESPKSVSSKKTQEDLARRKWEDLVQIQKEKSGETLSIQNIHTPIVPDREAYNANRRIRSRSQGSVFPGERVMKAVNSAPRGMWQCKGGNSDLSWKDEVLSILQSFTERTPGSTLELKDSGLTWHFGDADADFGFAQAKNLQLHFDQMLQSQQARVVMAPIKKYIVIQPANINKGKALSAIIHKDTRGYDLILGIGDERTDEDMFDVLQGAQCFTCTVGKKITKAQYYIDSIENVILTLQALPAAAVHYATGTGSVALQHSSNRGGASSTRGEHTPTSHITSPIFSESAGAMSPASFVLPGAFDMDRGVDGSQFWQRKRTSNSS